MIISTSSALDGNWKSPEVLPVTSCTVSHDLTIVTVLVLFFVCLFVFWVEDFVLYTLCLWTEYVFSRKELLFPSGESSCFGC